MRVIALLFVLTVAMPARAECWNCSDYQEQMLELQKRQTEALEREEKRREYMQCMREQDNSPMCKVYLPWH